MANCDKGRFEVLPQDFGNRAGKDAGASDCILDLKKIFPELFVQSTKIPRLLDQAWRVALDEVLAENEGIYAHKDGTAIHVFFENLPPSTSKLKLENAEKRIREMLEAGVVEPQDLPLSTEKKAEKKKAPKGNEALARVMKEGLRENPPMGEVTCWVSRIVQNIRHSSQNHPMVPELIQLSQQADVRFLPMWNARLEMLTGNLCVVCGGPKKSTKGELVRQDLAMLSSGIVEIVYLIAAKKTSVITIPLRLSTMQNEDINDFYFTVLHSLDQFIRQSFIFEIKGLPAEKLSPGNKKILEDLQSVSRAITVDTGILSKPDYEEDSGLKAYAYGFDLAGFKLPESEMINLVQKYAAYYMPRGIKTYIKGISSQEMLLTAKESGFAYLSGSAVFPMAKSSVEAQPLPFQQIREAQH